MNENKELLAEIKNTYEQNIKWAEDDIQSALEVLGDLIYDLQKLEEESVECDVF